MQTQSCSTKRVGTSALMEVCEKPGKSTKELKLGPEEPNNEVLSELGLKVCTLGEVEESRIEGRGCFQLEVKVLVAQ